ncbi:MAG: NOL1/NOP2/sun family putative RNA methylase [Nitrososphaeraceae archaeon]
MSCITLPNSNESHELSLKYNFKEWMIARYMSFIPEVEKFLEYINNKEPNRYIRVNTLKIDIDSLKQKLLEKDFILKKSPIPEVFLVIKSKFPIGATLEYLSGYYYIQDLSSCFAVECLDVRENDKVLDIAASPGGKTSFIAQKMNNNGIILALESNKNRLRKLMFNLSRCGVMNTVIWNINGEEITNYSCKFDKVLLDAPCSCDGIIQKDPSRKSTYSKENITFCSFRQSQMIEAALKVINPGGLLVYSTCSIAPEENEFIINSVIDRFDITVERINFGIDALPKFGDKIMDYSIKNTKRFYPHIHHTNGFFIAKLRINNHVK